MEARYRSRHHTGSLPGSLVYVRALVPPLAACLLPVVLVSLVAALQGYQIHPQVWWATCLALVAASAWTTFQLHRTVAEIVVEGDGACLRSAWNVAFDDHDPEQRAQPVLDVRDYGSWLFVTVGLSSHALDRKDWPDLDALRSALKQAYDRGRLIDAEPG